MATPSPDSKHCAVRLRASASQLMRHLRAAQPAHGLGTAAFSVLGMLYRDGEMTPTELARREGVKLQTLTRLLAALEADGLLARGAHASDARQSLLSITRRGARALTAQVHAREASLAEALARSLGAAEQAQLLRACALLDRVSAALGQTEAAKTP